MYMIKIEPELMTELWRIREGEKANGNKLPISKQVQHAVKSYIDDFKKN